MTLESFKVVTIICEPVLAQSIVKLSKKLGASGFTMTDVKGEGSGEKRSGEIPDEKVKIEIVATSDLAAKVMNEVAKAYFNNYSIIVYSSDISVIRGGKF